MRLKPEGVMLVGGAYFSPHWFGTQATTLQSSRLAGPPVPVLCIDGIRPLSRDPQNHARIQPGAADNCESINFDRALADTRPIGGAMNDTAATAARTIWLNDLRQRPTVWSMNLRAHLGCKTSPLGFLTSRS